jgi:hypothetical protein
MEINLDIYNKLV